MSFSKTKQTLVNEERKVRSKSKLKYREAERLEAEADELKEAIDKM